MITTEEIARLRAMLVRVDEAARGEWTTRSEGEGLKAADGPVFVYAAEDCEYHPVLDCGCNHTCRELFRQIDIAEFVAAIKNAAPALLAAAEAHLAAGAGA